MTRARVTSVLASLVGLTLVASSAMVFGAATSATAAEDPGKSVV